MELQNAYTVQSNYETDYEIERGKPMPSKNHGKIQARLSFILINKYKSKYDIESEVTLELTTGKATPDVIISEPTEDDWLNDEIRVTTPPITAIEILSPKQGLDDIKDKIVNIYFKAGVKSAWIIIPTFQTVYVISPDMKVNTFTHGTIKDPAVGVEIEMEDIFPKKHI
jgi:Uma2 family endonuclease